MTEQQLMESIHKAQVELLELRRNAPDPLAAIIGQEHVKRAFLVAVAGHHSIGIIHSPGMDPWLWLQAADALGVRNLEVGRPCQCGNFGDAYLPCHCRLADIERWQAKKIKAVRTCDIKIETIRVPISQLLSRRLGSGLDDVKHRIKIMAHCDNVQLDDCCTQLLKQASKELGYGQSDIETVTRVARTVANLEQSKLIQPHQISEAIQYRRIRSLRF